MVISEKWHSSQDGADDSEVEWIVTVAVKIIRDEIREKKYDRKTYPAKEAIASVDEGSRWIPHHLHSFLKVIVLSEVKQNSIGHAIV